MKSIVQVLTSRRSCPPKPAFGAKADAGSRSGLISTESSICQTRDRFKIPNVATAWAAPDQDATCRKRGENDLVLRGEAT